MICDSIRGGWWPCPCQIWIHANIYGSSLLWLAGWVWWGVFKLTIGGPCCMDWVICFWKLDISSIMMGWSPLRTISWCNKNHYWRNQSSNWRENYELSSKSGPIEEIITQYEVYGHLSPFLRSNKIEDSKVMKNIREFILGSISCNLEAQKSPQCTLQFPLKPGEGTVAGCSPLKGYFHSLIL